MDPIQPAHPRLSTQIRIFRGDGEYYRQLIHLAGPIAAQQVIVALLNMVGMVMVGQKGDTAVAAVGLAGQVFFLLNLVLFGVGSGSAIFTSQLWGRRDIRQLRKVLGLCLEVSLAVSLLFFVLAEFFPSQILRIYTTDAAVIALGSSYLRIFGWSFFFFTITYIYSIVLRTTGEVRLPMFVSIAALLLNTVLTYALVFGELGLPAMGVPGAALAALIARVLESSALLILAYLIRSPIAASPGELLTFDFRFVSAVIRPVAPVALNELLWSLGTTAYNVTYARMGTGPIAAIAMIGTIDNLAFAFVNSLAAASSIMVGNRIGSGEEETAFRYAGHALGVAAATGLVLGGAALLAAGKIFDLYKVSALVLQDARMVLIIYGSFLWLRAMNSIMVVGVLRPGGDTRFCLFLDGVIIWIIGVPLVAVGAFVFHFPVYWVYVLMMSEEVTKWILGLPRYFSRRWIHNLTGTVSVV
jgi:putative MATE family efflux protein